MPRYRVQHYDIDGCKYSMVTCVNCWCKLYKGNTMILHPTDGCPYIDAYLPYEKRLGKIRAILLLL